MGLYSLFPIYANYNLNNKKIEIDSYWKYKKSVNLGNETKVYTFLLFEF